MYSFIVRYLICVLLNLRFEVFCYPPILFKVGAFLIGEANGFTYLDGPIIMARVLYIWICSSSDCSSCSSFP